MAKKIIVAIIAMLLCCSMAGCGWNEAEVNTKESDRRMTLIYNDGFYQIVVDNETNVQYISRGSGGIYPMVDAKGKPLLWGGE